MTGETPAVHEALAVYAPGTTETERVPEGYKPSEVGVIPEDWEVKKISDMAGVKTGPFGSSLHESDYVDYGTPIITVEHLSEFGIIYGNLPLVSDSDKSRLKSYMLRRNDIVFSRVGSIDRNSLVSDKEGGWLFSGRLLRVRVTSDFTEPAYLSYHFHSEPFKQRVLTVAVGQTMASLNTQILKNISVVLPPLHEQRAIAAALSDVDALISALDELIAKKRAVKTAAMQQLLTGKQRLPGFSGEWEVKRLGEVFALLNTANNPRSDLSEHGEVGYVHYGDLHATTSSVLDFSKTSTPRIARRMVRNIPLLQEGDLIMVDASEDYEGVGKSVEVRNLNDREFVAGLHTFLLRGKKGLFADGFKGYLQYIPSVRSALVRLATGISVYGISKNNVRSIEVSLPGTEEQLAIAAVLSDMDAEIEALEARREKTRQVKRGMMQELLAGRTRLV